MPKHNTTSAHRGVTMKSKLNAKWPARYVLIVVGALATACDTEVTNPGPINDASLDAPAAHSGLVDGMNMALASAVSIVADYGGVVAQEYTADGSTANWGYDQDLQQGILDVQGRSDPWNLGQRARWVAEDGIERLRNVLGEQDFANSPLAAEALVYAGFANRLLGENMCEAVIDGGPREPHTAFLERAVAAFSGAIEVAGRVGEGDLVLAARAGRAAAQLRLGRWDEAVADAEAIPIDFQYQAHFDNVAEWQWNTMYHRSAGEPFRNNTAWGTYYEDYYPEYGDARVAWTQDEEFPTTSVSGLPFLRQLKYTSRSAPINLATGREMKLIVAEAELRDGDWEAALDIINELRAQSGVEPWSATGVEETWTHLKRERGIELWLEGRRLGDLWRWTEAQVPGAMEDMTGRSLCFPVHQSEIDTNPNIN